MDLIQEWASLMSAQGVRKRHYFIKKMGFWQKEVIVSFTHFVVNIFQKN